MPQYKQRGPAKAATIKQPSSIQGGEPDLQDQLGNASMQDYIASGSLEPDRADRAPREGHLRQTDFGDSFGLIERDLDDWSKDAQIEPGLLPADPMSIVAQEDPDWGLFVQACGNVSEAKRQSSLQSIRTQGRWEEMLDALGPEHMREITSWLQEDVGDDTGESVEERIDGARNSGRAAEALAVVDRMAQNDPEGRLSGRIRELLALGVALPRSTRGRLGEEGVLSINQVERACEAILALPVREFLRLSMLLELSGDASRLQQSFVLLEATAARAGEQDLSVLEDFSDEIREMDDRELRDQTSVIQTTSRDKTAMEEKFKRGSGVAALQTVAAEADPVLALRMNQNFELDKDASGSQAALQQEQAIERHTRSPAIARKTEDAREMVLDHLTSTGARANEQAAVKAYLSGGEYDEAFYKSALQKLQRGLGLSFPGDEALRQVRESAGGGRGGTMDANDLVQEAQTTLGVEALTGSEVEAHVDESLVASFGQADRAFTPENLEAWRPHVEALLTQAAPNVRRGQDVVFEVRWERGGVNYMTLTDVDERGGSFLVHNTSNGNSAWIDKADLLQGNFARVGRGSGLITGLIS